MTEPTLLHDTEFDYANLQIRLEFKLQDCWIGCYWQRLGPVQHVWVCLLPMLPIHIWWYTREFGNLPTVEEMAGILDDEHF